MNRVLSGCFTEEKTLCVTSIHSTYTQGLLEQIEYKLKSRKSSNGFFLTSFFPSSPHVDATVASSLLRVHNSKCLGSCVFEPEMTSGSVCALASPRGQRDSFFFRCSAQFSGSNCICITSKPSHDRVLPQPPQYLWLAPHQHGHS